MIEHEEKLIIVGVRKKKSVRLLIIERGNSEYTMDAVTAILL